MHAQKCDIFILVPTHYRVLVSYPETTQRQHCQLELRQPGCQAGPSLSGLPGSQAAAAPGLTTDCQVGTPDSPRLSLLGSSCRGLPTHGQPPVVRDGSTEGASQLPSPRRSVHLSGGGRQRCLATQRSSDIGMHQAYLASFSAPGSSHAWWEWT